MTLKSKNKLRSPDSETRNGASTHTLVCAGVFCGVMALGLVQVVLAGLRFDAKEVPTSWRDWREGKTTQTFEKQLDLQLPLRSALITLANTVRYHVVGGGGDQVRVGRDGWLFLTDEIKYESSAGPSWWLDSAPAFNARMDLIRDLSKYLAERDVKLVVALVPDKARLYSQQLEPASYPSYNQTRYGDGLAALKLRKVEVVDLLAKLKPLAMHAELYYRTDTHWNQRGAQLAAQAVATTITKFNLPLQKSSFTTQDQGEVQERPGDLLRLMGMEHVANFLRPKPDSERSVKTVPTASTGASQSLFGDAATPVVLVGTSYSLRGNFHGYLQESLSSAVLNSAKDGGGFLQALTAYLKDDSFREAKPQVLVWEIPERMLGSPLVEEPSWLEKIKTAGAT
jgi:alginate O-acetyltransferase complex protein AlgJ